MSKYLPEHLIVYFQCPEMFASFLKTWTDKKIDWRQRKVVLFGDINDAPIRSIQGELQMAYVTNADAIQINNIRSQSSSCILSKDMDGQKDRLVSAQSCPFWGHQSHPYPLDPR